MEDRLQGDVLYNNIFALKKSITNFAFNNFLYSVIRACSRPFQDVLDGV